MNYSIEDISKEEYEIREKLYEYYFEILEEINGEKKDIKSKEYKEIITNTTFQTILFYIKKAIPILINRKIEEYINNNKSEENINSGKTINEYNDEYQLRKYENQIRQLMKIIFQLKVERESLGYKIQHFLKMEEEFKEMKNKYKYKDGHFLDNDRKDNEIEILRRENSNIKKAMAKIEKENENLKQEMNKIEEENEILNTENLNDKKIIKDLKDKVDYLVKKIDNIEKRHRDSTSNSSINININNNGKSVSKWIFKRNIELKINNTNITNCESLSSRKKLMLKDSQRKKIGLLENTFSTNSFHKKMSRISSEKSISPKNRRYKKTNSMNMKKEDSKKKEIVSKYLTNINNTNYDFSKISKLMKGTKFTRKFHNSIFTSKTKLTDFKNDKNIK